MVAWSWDPKASRRVQKYWVTKVPSDHKMFAALKGFPNLDIRYLNERFDLGEYLIAQIGNLVPSDSVLQKAQNWLVLNFREALWSRKCRRLNKQSGEEGTTNNSIRKSSHDLHGKVESEIGIWWYFEENEKEEVEQNEADLGRTLHFWCSGNSVCRVFLSFQSFLKTRVLCI